LPVNLRPRGQMTIRQLLRHEKPVRQAESVAGLSKPPGPPFLFDL